MATRMSVLFSGGFHWFGYFASLCLKKEKKSWGEDLGQQMHITKNI